MMLEESESTEDFFNHVANPNDKQREVINLYTDWAQNYDRHVADIETYHGPSSVAKHLHNQYSNTEGRVLDIGAGTGLLGVELQKRGFRNIDALDPNDNMLNKAREREIYRDHILDFLDKHKLDIETDTYDVVIGCGVFVPGHVTEDCFDEICRIIKPGGLFIISSNDKYTLDSYASYHNNVRSAVKLYEEKGLWKVETDTALPHLGDAKAAATTVRISK